MAITQLREVVVQVRVGMRLQRSVQLQEPTWRRSHGIWSRGRWGEGTGAKQGGSCLG